MLRYSQILAIVEKLQGIDRMGIRPGDLDEPWQTIFERVGWEVDPRTLERELWAATEGLEGRTGLFQEMMAFVPGEGAIRCFRSLEEIAAGLPPIGWLWKSWIPRGMLSLLGAAPGAGKSLVALDLARRIIHGCPWPDRDLATDSLAVPKAGTAVGAGTGSNVIYVDAEAIPQLQNQRAEAWGMDRSRVFLMMPPEAYGMIDFGDEAEQDRLVDMCYRLDPELVVVDSLSSISLKGENNVEDVRAILAFLGSVAREFDVGLLLVHHLRKRGKGQSPEETGLVTADDFRGSSHIIAMSRSVLALSVVQEGPEPDRNGPRRLEVVKTNLCRYPPALGLVFEGDDAGAPWLHYTDAPKPYREPTQAHLCAKWLVSVLQEMGVPVKPCDVVTMAKEAGFRKGVVYRARNELEGVVVDTEGKFSPHNMWSLNGHD